MIPWPARPRPAESVCVDLAATSRPAAHLGPSAAHLWGRAPTWYSSTCCSAFNLSLSRRNSARESKTGSGTASRSSDVLKSIYMLCGVRWTFS